MRAPMRLVVAVAVGRVVALSTAGAGGALASRAGPRLQPLLSRPHARRAYSTHCTTIVPSLDYTN